jgi:hypothetical protein
LAFRAALLGIILLLHAYVDSPHRLRSPVSCIPKPNESPRP